MYWFNTNLITAIIHAIITENNICKVVLSKVYLITVHKVLSLVSWQVPARKLKLNSNAYYEIKSGMTFSTKTIDDAIMVDAMRFNSQYILPIFPYAWTCTKVWMRKTSPEVIGVLTRGYILYCRMYLIENGLACFLNIANVVSSRFDLQFSAVIRKFHILQYVPK